MNRMMRMVRWAAAAMLLMAGVVLRVQGQIGMAGGGAGAIGGGAAGGGGAGDAFAGPKPFLEAQPKGAVIRLDAEVDDVMLRSIKRRVDSAGKQGCSVLIFEIDTLGGQILSALEISQYLKELPTKNFITVAWVHPKAYSAGAMITAACQHVVMSTAGQYGDCAPIAVATTWTGGHELVPLPAAERAKQESPVVNQFLDSAEKNGWNPDVLLAMVAVEAQVFEMHNNVTDTTVFVGENKKAELLAVEAQGPGGVAAPKPWRVIRTIDDEKSLLTLNDEQAVKMGLAQAIINNEQQLKGVCRINGDLLLLEFNWAERATVFLTAWSIRLLLFVGLVVFGLLEFSHPGVSVFGIAAVICLILLIGAPFLTGLAQIWEIALIVVGVGIIIADLLAFGGIGLLAVPGFILMAIGLIASFVPTDPGGFMTSHGAWMAAEKGLAVVVGGTFLAVGSFYLLAKYLAFTPGFNRLQLVPGGRRGGGGAAAAAVAGGGAATEVRDAADRPADEAVFVGAIGRAATDLRPAGKARFGDHLVGVVSYGSFVAKDTEIEVLEVSGMKIVVKPRMIPEIPPTPTDAPDNPPPPSAA